MTVDDAEVLVGTVAEGFETFRTWAPPGWTVGDAGFSLPDMREGVARPTVWGLIAEDAGQAAGHVMFLQARERVEPRAEIPGLAHLWQLFVRPEWWGGGLAARLNGLAVEEAGRQGYERMRLFTPAGNLRARGFYEREGWSTDGVATFEAHLGQDMVQYTRALP